MNTKTLLPMALLLAGAAPLVRAESCTGASDFSGQYMFVATRQLFSTPPPTPERVTNVEPRFSPTPVGSILRGALGVSPFAAVGRLLADGQGGLISSAAGTVYLTARVGSYSVTPECTLNVTITDGLLPVDLIAPLTPGAVRFTGVLQSRGGESNLIQVSSGSGSTLTLVRAHVSNSCSNATFSGAYGLAASGVQMAGENEKLASPNLEIFSMVGRIVSDGAGNLVQDAPGIPLQLTGTYELQADCAGTAKLTDGKTTRSINFVLVHANPAQNFTAIGVAFSRPVMRFVFTDPKMAVIGEGREATGRL